MTKYIQPGDSLEYSNSGSAISSGDVVVLGDRISVAVADIAATSGKGTVNLDGVYELAAINTAAFSVGDPLYWDTSALKLTNTPNTTTVWAGRCHEAKAETGTLGRVRLSDHPKMITEVSYTAGTNLSALSPTASAITGSAGTYAIAAEPTGAEVDTAIDQLKDKVDTALDLKADNADVETLRTEIETRLDAIDTAIAAFITNMKAAGVMHD